MHDKDGIEKCYFCERCAGEESLEIKKDHQSLMLKRKDAPHLGDCEYDLSSIVCFENSKYSSYVRHKESEWVHHDNTTEEGECIIKLALFLDCFSRLL